MMKLLQEIDSAVQSLHCSMESAYLPTIDVGLGIDFYDVVRDFEISLIRQALMRTNGSQVRAAEMLGLKATTLNCKIKNLSIDHKSPFALAKNAALEVSSIE